MIVADANLVVYRNIKGPLTPSVDAVLDKDADWRIATLWRCEFTSAVVKMVRAKILDEKDAIAAMGTAARDMWPHELEVPQERAMQAALRYAISAYDAQYVALAEMLGVRCVTADATLARKTPAICISLSEFIK